MKIHRISSAVFSGILFVLILGTPAVTAGETVEVEKNQPSSSGSSKPTSTFQSYKPAVTTQKMFTIKNDGRNEKSSVTQYDSTPAFDVFEDKDRDGRFGEKELPLVDSDLDGRKGEKEKKLGTENVSQNQKVTVLNNMGSGSALSDFKASGQTQRSSIFTKPESQENQKSPQSQAASEKAEKPQTADAQTIKKPRVLVA